MNNPIKVQVIAEELEFQLDAYRTFLHVETGEIVSVSSDELRAAEDEEPFDDLPDWQQDNRRIAIDVIEDFENYIELPTKYEINEYEIMEEFCLSISQPRKQDLLLKAIKGRGAFRRFKDKVIEYDLEKQWYSYRGDRLKEIAIEWCQENNLSYIE